MGAIIETLVVPTEDEPTNSSKDTAMLFSVTNHPQSPKKKHRTNTEDVIPMNSQEMDDFIGQFGAYFNAPSAADTASTSETQYTLSSDQCLSTAITPNPTLKRKKSPPPLHRRCSTFQNDNEFKIQHGKCQVVNCKAIKRIIKILKWHSCFHERHKREALMHKVMDSQYHKYLLDDYQHVLNV
eukprot:343417_1